MATPVVPYTRTWGVPYPMRGRTVNSQSELPLWVIVKLVGAQHGYSVGPAVNLSWARITPKSPSRNVSKRICSPYPPRSYLMFPDVFLPILSVLSNSDSTRQNVSNTVNHILNCPCNDSFKRKEPNMFTII